MRKYRFWGGLVCTLATAAGSAAQEPVTLPTTVLGKTAGTTPVIRGSSYPIGMMPSGTGYSVPVPQAGPVMLPGRPIVPMPNTLPAGATLPGLAAPQAGPVIWVPMPINAGSVHQFPQAGIAPVNGAQPMPMPMPVPPGVAVPQPLPGVVPMPKAMPQIMDYPGTPMPSAIAQPMAPGTLPYTPEYTMPGMVHQVPHAMPAPIYSAMDIASAGQCGPNGCPTPSLTADCNPCGPRVCGIPGRFWLRGDFIFGWVRPTRLPPLVTNAAPGTPVPPGGILGTPGTTLAFGGEDVYNAWRPGFRVRAGGWLDPEQRIGVELGYFWLDDSSIDFRDGSANGGRIVGRPFFNAITGAPAVQRVSAPGNLAGFVDVAGESQSIRGAEALLRKNICCDPCWYRLDGLLGYRYLRYADSLTINEDLRPLGGAVVPGTQILVNDSFSARNTFNGLSVGLTSEIYSGPLSLIVSGRASFGQMDSVVKISGSTTNNVPGVAAPVQVGGLLAQSSNIGRYESSRWTVIPEGELTLAYQLNRNMRFMAGYSFIYMTNVARASDQIDLAVNPNLIPPALAPGSQPQRPTFLDHKTDIWMHMVNLGLELRY